MHRQLDTLWLEEAEPQIDSRIVRYLKKHHEKYQSLLERQNELLGRHPVIVSVINDDEEMVLSREEHKALKEYMANQSEMDGIVIEYSYFFGQTIMFDYVEVLNILYHKLKKEDEGRKERGNRKMSMSFEEEKDLIETTLNSLAVYAEEIAQDMWKPLMQIRKVVKEMSSFWDMQEEKDWERNFNNHVILSFYDQKAEPITEEEKLKALRGLTYYTEEVNYLYGEEAAERIQEIRKLITEMESRWKLPAEKKEVTCKKPEQSTGNLET